MRLSLALVLALLAVFLAQPVRSETNIAGEPNIVTARFTTGNPATVSVDVKEIGSVTQIGNNLPATHEQVDSLFSDVWSIDLSLIAGYPTDCTQKTYLVRFTPAGVSDCTPVGTPGACVEQLVDVGGARCRLDPLKDIGYVRTTSPVSAQGITEALIAYEARRGRAPIRWRQIRATGSGDVRWEVFFYVDSIGFPHLKCTAESGTNPLTLTTPQLTALGTGTACLSAN